MSFFMRCLLVALLAVAAAIPSFAAGESTVIRIDQPSPDSRTFITATISGMLACPNPIPAAMVNGSKIVIDASRSCYSSLSSGTFSANIGNVAGGVYEVILTGVAGWSQELRSTLTVRDADPFRVFPSGATTAGGTEIQIWSNGANPARLTCDVRIDGQLLTSISHGAYSTYLVPPHQAGDVDVVVYAPNSSAIGPSFDIYTLRRAFRYYDPAAAPDPFLFERVLFPIMYEGNGAYGSQWTTDNRVGVSWMVPPSMVQFWRPPCSGCPSRIDNQAATTRVPEYSLDKGTSASGSLQYVMRGTTNALRTSSRIRDLSRQASSAGVNIPVVFENDFKRIIDLIDIPVDSRFRATLRVWSDNANASPGAVLYNTKGSTTIPLKFSSASVDALPFATADLTPYMPGPAAGSFANVQLTTSEGAGVWAMISITNNETQEVTIIAPR